MSAATGAARRRTTPLGVKKVGGLYFGDQSKYDVGTYGPSWWKTILFAPYDHKPSTWAAIIVGLLMELIGMMVFALVFNVVKANVAVDPIGSLVLGAAAAGAYYAITGWHTRNTKAEQDNELPRHLGWTISLVNFLTLRTGLVIFLAYAVMQLAGALIAGGIMSALGVAATVLPPTALPANTWGLEFLGVFCITFTLVYNNFMGATLDEEHTRLREANLLTAATRFFLTLAFFSFNVYYYEPTLYLSALVSQCMTSACPVGSPWVFYTFFPWVGAVAAAAVFWIIIAIYSNCTTGRKTKPYRRGEEGESSAAEPAAATESLITPYDR